MKQVLLNFEVLLDGSDYSSGSEDKQQVRSSKHRSAVIKTTGTKSFI